jgi:hypothetical protein
MTMATIRVQLPTTTYPTAGEVIEGVEVDDTLLRRAAAGTITILSTDATADEPEPEGDDDGELREGEDAG